MPNELVFWNGVIHILKELRMDGLPNAARSEMKLFKIIWLVITILSACVCVVLITESTTEYFKHSVSTTTRLLQEQHSVFPTITICQVNSFSTDYATDIMKQANATNMYDLETFTNRTTGEYLSDEAKQKMSNLDTIIISCKVGQAECNASDFEWIWNPSKYNCYRCNSRKQRGDSLLTVNAPGLTNFNFELILYAGLPDYWSNRIGLYAKRGFFVYIHNATEYPFNTNPSPIVVMVSKSTCCAHSMSNSTIGRLSIANAV